MPLAQISAVGTLASGGFTTGKTTQAITPVTKGDLLVLGVWDATSSGAPNVSAVSGGGVTTWSQVLASAQFTTPPVTQRGAMWMGQVTATGSATVTITSSSGSWPGQNGLYLQEFTCVGVSSQTVWAIDGSQTGTKSNTTSSPNITFPTLTPSGLWRAYIGAGYAGGTGQTTGGTAGYTVQVDSVNHNPFIYNGNVSTAQTPLSTMTATNTSQGMGILVTATNPIGSFMSFFGGPFHHEHELEQRFSGLYVQRRKISGIKPSGGRRVLAHV
jgi:hypothetical protein